jgi:hypothetical protein
LPDVGVDVGDAVLLGNLGEVADPGHTPGPHELVPAILGAAAGGVSVAAVIDDEVELRPILRGLAHVVHLGIGEEMRPSFSCCLREQAFVHADVLDAVFSAQLVGLVGDPLVVHAPGMLGLVLVGVVADGIALDRFRLPL